MTWACAGSASTGSARPGWRGFNEDRDTAFVDGLYGTGLRLAEWASVLDVELPGEDAAAGRFPRAWLAAACIKGGREGRYYRIPRSVMHRVAAYLDPVEGSRAEAIGRARRRAVRAAAGVRIVTGCNRAVRGLCTCTGPRAAAQRAGGCDRPGRAAPAVPPRPRRGWSRWRCGWARTGMPKQAHGWEDTFQSANARVARAWAAAQGQAAAESLPVVVHAPTWPAFLRAEVVLDPVGGVGAAAGGLHRAEKRDLRDQFGDVWFQLATLLGHADPAVTRDCYLEPFTGLQVDYLMSLLDEDEHAAIDQLVRPGRSGQRQGPGAGAPGRGPCPGRGLVSGRGRRASRRPQAGSRRSG